jgi:hypothetical protein
MRQPLGLGVNRVRRRELCDEDQEADRLARGGRTECQQVVRTHTQEGRTFGHSYWG